MKEINLIKLKIMEIINKKKLIKSFNKKFKFF